MDLADAKSVAKLFASNFIARSDVKARQLPNGEWRPDDTPFSMADLLSHINGQQSLGHYMLDKQGRCKLFAFDIDLQKATPEKNIWWPVPTHKSSTGLLDFFENGDPRAQWEGINDRPEWLQYFYIEQMMSCAKVLVKAIEEVIQVPVAVSYSGHKGLHVYGFTGLCKGEEAREAALIALEHSNSFEAWRGKNFFVGKRVDNDAIAGWPQLSVEIFPKQDQVSEGGYGNLMRLPLGRNLLASEKNPHRAKFIDLRYNHQTWGLRERNAVEALTVEDQWTGVV